jgi:GNAT superfamily N-acetyltransferase
MIVRFQQEALLRPATTDDHAWLYHLHEQAHRELVERAYGPWEEGAQQGFFRPLVNDHEVFVLSNESEPVGAVYLGERDHDVWLALVEVLPTHQGRGYGTYALRWVVARAAAQGKSTLLQVHRVNEHARRLYVSAGFAPVGETPRIIFCVRFTAAESARRYHESHFR